MPIYFLVRVYQAVTQAALGKDITWVMRVRLQLSSQTRDVGSRIVVMRPVAPPIGFMEQIFGTYDTSDVFH